MLNNLFSTIGEEIIYYLKEISFYNYYTIFCTQVYLCFNDFVDGVMDCGVIMQLFVDGSQSDSPRTALATTHLEETLFTTSNVQYKKSSIARFSTSMHVLLLINYERVAFFLSRSLCPCTGRGSAAYNDYRKEKAFPIFYSI